MIIDDTKAIPMIEDKVDLSQYSQKFPVKPGSDQAASPAAPVTTKTQSAEDIRKQLLTFF